MIERSFNKDVKPNLIIQLYDSIIQWFIAFVLRFSTKEKPCCSLVFFRFPAFLLGNVNSMLRLPLVSLQISAYFLLLGSMSYPPEHCSRSFFNAGIKETKSVSSGFSSPFLCEGKTGFVGRIFLSISYKNQPQP